ncbi:hypothetical protein GCM10022268_06060 [Sphingomonas cynarae]|uniref:DUF86 domain-containing protein n=1 Tax=Sphingomonas cynarae TaxID=930197 RepID=A0ABP7CZ90_9SPHN
MLSRKAALRLQDIIEDVDRIAMFIDGMSLSAFRADERTMFAVACLPQRITEAAIQIESDDAVLLGPDLPIVKMRALGNRLRHEYRYIDAVIIFDLARVEVPLARAAAELALED